MYVCMYVLDEKYLLDTKPPDVKLLMTTSSMDFPLAFASGARQLVVQDALETTVRSSVDRLINQFLSI